jgi:hypothetical protein
VTLNRDQILKAGLTRESVEVPELGGAVLVRVLTLKEVGEIQAAQKAAPDPLAVYPKLVALATVDDDGAPLFAGEDVKLIESLPWPAVNAIAVAILRINRMSGDDPKGQP